MVLIIDDPNVLRSLASYKITWIVYLHTEWCSNYVGGEWGHWLSIVWLNDSGKKWNGPWGNLLGKESQDSKLCKTSVVELGSQATLLGLLRHVLGKTEWIVKVEWNWVRDSFWSSNEVREVTWLSSGHVMLVARGGKLTPEFKEGDEAEDLPLGIIRYGIPKSRWVGLRWEWGSIHLHGPWEFDSVSMNNVSYEGKHGNTSVLDLGVTEESNGGLVGGSPEFSLGEVERIIESNNRVELLGKCLKVSLGLRNLGGGNSGLWDGWGGESGGTGEEGKSSGNGELHVRNCFIVEIVSRTVA